MRLLKNQTLILYIAVFYVVAILLRYYFLIVKPDFYINLNSYWQSLLSGVGPLIAGLLMIKVFKRPNMLSWFAVGFWNTIWLVLLPILLFFAMGSFNVGQPNYTIALTITVSFFYAVFEEYGWRAYLQSELAGLKRIYKYLIISVLWYFWHLDFGFDLQHLLSYFFVFMGSVGIGYVADKSKSLVLPSLFHMFFNILFSGALVDISFLQKVILLSICIISVIFVMWRQQKNIKKQGGFVSEGH